MRSTIIVLALLVVSVPRLAPAQKFLPDDPIWSDPDRRSISEPREIELSKGYDFLENTFANPGGPPHEAANVNTLGEVPDSSWFTNRVGLEDMSADELARGPNRGSGPDLSGQWVVESVKSEGITPGLRIKDARGDVYLVKFDPAGHPQLTTSAEVIGTKFFHAFGYNVPENYLLFVRKERFAISGESRFTDRSGRKRQLTPQDLNDVLDNIGTLPGGIIPVMASKILPGKPVGRFKYYGTRSDDPNDIFPHEDRRELRGLRVFDAWLNHNDSDAVNTLDVYVDESGSRYIKHYLIDFGTVMGSGAFEPKALRAGNEHYLEWAPILRSVFTFGWWDRPWRTIEYPDFKSVGRFEAGYFRPEAWKPDYPNPAHDRMTAADALWATRTVSRFTDTLIRALVRTGQFPLAAENYVVQTLTARRDKIIRHYFSAAPPLDDFRVADGHLSFRNLGVEAGLEDRAVYKAQWFRFDNESGKAVPAGPEHTLHTTRLPVPGEGSPYLMVRVETIAPSRADWSRKVEVYIRRGTAGAEIVGIERS